MGVKNPPAGQAQPAVLTRAAELQSEGNYAAKHDSHKAVKAFQEALVLGRQIGDRA